MTPTALDERTVSDIRVVPAAGPTAIADRIVACHDALAGCPSLDPSPRTNRLFTELVRTCTTTAGAGAIAALSDPRLSERRFDLVRICAEGESLLEEQWAHRIHAAVDAESELAAFPYIDNYHRLVRLELGALAGAGWTADPQRRLAFLGGGPLPLSALLTHRAVGCRVDVIDKSAAANRRAETFLDRVQPGSDIHAVEADATRVADMRRVLAECDLIIVAALVGLDQAEKRNVLRTVADAVQPGTFVVIRSAAELRTMLYPDVTSEDVVSCGLSPIALVHPMDEVVNSVWVTRR